MLKLTLKQNEQDRILKGDPWIFSNEVKKFEGEFASGEVCDVYTSNNEFLCKGFFNAASKIMVRVLSKDINLEIDKEFFKEKILYAINMRKDLGFMGSTRLIFSEADELPGLIVDKYGDYLSCQFLCLGMDKRKSMIIEILVDLLNPKGIYERSDVPVRLKEGLEMTKGFLYGGPFETKVIIEENGIKLRVDIENGQKTGYFLDQKLNRDNIKYYSKGKDVLDCFSHTGGFALNAAKAGALSVTAADISEKAVNDIKFNAELNGFSNLKTECVDVFDYLRDENNFNKFDTIVLDPPAFTKSKQTVKHAYKGYKEINLQAIKMIKHGGYLLTFSCSQHMTPELFFEMLNEAIVDSGRSAQMLEFKIQSPDHPTLLSTNSSLYLKCIILRIN